MSEKILGISAYYHDSAAALLIDGEIVAAAHEERFTRIKHDQSFPANAIRYVLSEADGHADIGAIRQNEVRVTTECFDKAENIIPATAVLTNNVVFQFEQDLVDFKRREDGLDKNRDLYSLFPDDAVVFGKTKNV